MPAIPDLTERPAHRAHSASGGDVTSVHSQDPTPSTAELPLSRPQVRLLSAVGACEGIMNCHVMSEVAGVPLTWVVGHAFKAGKANRVPSLVERGLVEEVVIDLCGKEERCCRITDLGREVLSSLELPMPPSIGKSQADDSVT